MEPSAKKKALSIALAFFAKVSAWIIIPAFAIVIGHFASKSGKSHAIVVLAAALIAILISFYGIYKESAALIARHDI